MWVSVGVSAAGLSGCHESCEDDGRNHADGESWTCTDGCNVCTCHNGVMEQTDKWCADTDKPSSEAEDGGE